MWLLQVERGLCKRWLPSAPSHGGSRPTGTAGEGVSPPPPLPPSTHRPQGGRVPSARISPCQPPGAQQPPAHGSERFPPAMKRVFFCCFFFFPLSLSCFLPSMATQLLPPIPLRCAGPSPEVGTGTAAMGTGTRAAPAGGTVPAGSPVSHPNRTRSVVAAELWPGVAQWGQDPPPPNRAAEGPPDPGTVQQRGARGAHAAGLGPGWAQMFAATGEGTAQLGGGLRSLRQRLTKKRGKKKKDKYFSAPGQPTSIFFLKPYIYIYFFFLSAP